MEIQELKQKLEFNVPQVVNSFGGIETFLQILFKKFQFESEVVNYLYKLLSSSEEAVVISPIDLSFKLYDNFENITDKSSIIFEEPYSVYTIDGELLYRVSNHNGVFVYSILDRALLLQSKTADQYYLHFNTYQGKKTILLVVNAFVIQTNKKIAIGPNLSESLTKDYTNIVNSSILFKVTDGYRDMTKIGLPLYPIQFYFLPSAASTIPSVASLISNPSTQKQIENLDLEPYFAFHPQTSGWITITQESSAGYKPLKLNNISGAGDNRLLEVAPFIYYVGIGSEISLDNLFQNLGLVQSNISLSGNQTINLNVNLIK